MRKTQPIAVCRTQTEADQVVDVYLPRDLPRSLDTVCRVKVPLMESAVRQDDRDDIGIHPYGDWPHVDASSIMDAMMRGYEDGAAPGPRSPARLEIVLTDLMGEPDGER